MCATRLSCARTKVALNPDAKYDAAGAMLSFCTETENGGGRGLLILLLLYPLQRCMLSSFYGRSKDVYPAL